jgi:hypothetical protein
LTNDCDALRPGDGEGQFAQDRPFRFVADACGFDGENRFAGWQMRRRQHHGEGLQDLDTLARQGCRRMGLRPAALDKTSVPAARFLAEILQPVHEDARHVALGSLSFGHAILARLALGRLLRLPVDLCDTLLGIRQIMSCRREVQRLVLAIPAPVAAIARGAEGGQLDDSVHGVEQFAVVADDDCTAAPAGK